MWCLWKNFSYEIEESGVIMEKLIFCTNHCGWIIKQVKEIQVLLNLKSVETVRLNRNRAIASIDSAIESLTDLKKTIEEM